MARSKSTTKSAQRKARAQTQKTKARKGLKVVSGGRA